MKYGAADLEQIFAEQLVAVGVWSSEFDQVPQAYRWLAAHGDGGPVPEFPKAINDLYRERIYRNPQT